MDPKVRAQLAARFEDGEVRQFQGRGGQTFDYIEDETVMDRLDEVLGVGEWSVQVEPISVADGIVKVTLTAFGKAYEDFGYASNAGPQAESLKEAVSDGIRRCGRYLGVGRYLYKKHTVSGGREASSARPSAQSAPTNGHRAGAPPSSGPAAPEFPPNEWDEEFPPIGGLEEDPARCTKHGVAWTVKEGDRYHKDGAGWCRHPANVKRPAGSRR